MNLSELITWACSCQASDIHLLPHKGIWLRCGGEILFFPEFYYDTKNLIQLLNSQQQQQLLDKHSIDLGYQLENGIRLRINLFQRWQGIGAVLRIIPPHLLRLNELPAPAVFYELIKEPHGLLLVTGPTGSGKSTTLAALVAQINHQAAKHILTLEDPIEFIHVSQRSLITQRERYAHFDDYPAALRSALREDPDVILIGEIRDIETMQLAITAAETGHLVLGTLHTSTAAHTINRIVDIFPPAQQNTICAMLADCLVAVISQQLVNDTHGKRHAIFEILRATPAVRQLIRDKNSSQLITIMQTGMASGMQTFANASLGNFK